MNGRAILVVGHQRLTSLVTTEVRQEDERIDEDWKDPRHEVHEVILVFLTEGAPITGLDDDDRDGRHVRVERARKVRDNEHNDECETVQRLLQSD